jgi:superfamily II DNA or RNA helicase
MTGPITVFEDTHLWVPWSALDIARVEADLVITNESAVRSRMFGGKGKGPERVALWEDAGDYALLPRGYDPPLLPGVRTRVVKRRPPPTNAPFWPFLRKLRPYQVPAWEALLAKQGDKLLMLGCGKGKTTLALAYAAVKATKTLIIVDRDFLIDQWTDEICGTPDKPGCYEISPDEIGRVQASSRTIGDKFTLAMVHTLAKQEFDESFYNQFGLIIVDEAHVLAATTFAGVVPNFRGERLLLTATPFRRDGMFPLFMYHGGGLEPCFVDLTRTQSTKWFFRRLPHVKHFLDEKEIRGCYRKMPGGNVRTVVKNGKATKEHQMMLNRAKYETAIAASVPAYTSIIDEVERAVDKGRNVLFLGSRVEQLKYLHGYFGEALGHDSGLVTGDVTGAKRREAFGHQCLFITTSIGNKALDVPRLDTLYLMWPTDDEGFIRQAVGRIDREHEGKRSPIAVVFHHTGTPSLERKSDDMIDAIKRIDPRADIRFV